jgi:predicted aminopeptidase
VVESTSDATLKRKLERSISIRALPAASWRLDNGSYKNYADVGRRAVLWNVMATPALPARAEAMVLSIAGA